MDIRIDPNSNIPIFRQLADRIHFAINTGDIAPGEKLPSLRSIAADCNIALNTVAKAMKRLEAMGLVTTKRRSGIIVADSAPAAGRYAARGVSATKSEVHAAVDTLDRGLFPNAFCKITEDFLTGNPDKCNVIHSDGAGTKSIVAYLHYRETGDASVFRGIAQDSIVMNIDDMLCVGADGRIVISGTINRNATNCPGEVISELIDGTETFLDTMRGFGLDIHSGGGETADVGDLTGSVVVDSCCVAVMDKKNVITGDGIVPGLAIVGLASSGQAVYETAENSGIGSNGLTSARHDLLSKYYAEKYPETFDPTIDASLVYSGPFKLDDSLPDSTLTVGEAILSPTRTYAPVIIQLLAHHRSKIKGIVHCSGGAQTKCLKFGRRVHFIKDAMMPIPPLFSTIQRVTGTDWKEMYQVFNMGHRMEIFCKPSHVNTIVKTAESFGIAAQQIGHTEKSARKDGRNHLTIQHESRKLTYS